MLRLLQLHIFLPLAQGTMACQLPNSKMTSSALVSSMMDVNHLQFRDRTG
jgi:hypothetical protein